MQTFLPYPDFQKSVECLDYRRLGKQRVEGRQLVKAILLGGAWSNHPCTHMWQNHVSALDVYTDYCIREWVRRGYNNSMELNFDPDALDLINELTDKPNWFGDGAFHASHRSNLLRKDPKHYSQFGWKEPHDLPYVWPT